MDCYICLEEINNRHLGFGHFAGGIYYQPTAGAQGRDAVIHAIHVKCLKGLVATEEAMCPNQCGTCRAVLDIPANSPLLEAFFSPEIQANDRLRRRWIAYFPQLDRPEPQRISRCRTFSRFLGKTITYFVMPLILLGRASASALVILGVACAVGPILGLICGMCMVGTIKIMMFLSRSQELTSAIEIASVFIGIGLFSVLFSVYENHAINIIRWTNRQFNLYLDNCWELSSRTGNDCGSFVQKHVFVITNRVTLYVANTRLFRRFV